MSLRPRAFRARPSATSSTASTTGSPSRPARGSTTAAERLGYVPNAMASALRAGRTEIVLLALPSWPLGPAVAEWVSAGVAEIERLGYTPLVHFQQGSSGASFDRACDRVRPVALIAPGRDLPPERVDGAARERHARGARDRPGAARLRRDADRQPVPRRRARGHAPDRARAPAPRGADAERAELRRARRRPAERRAGRGRSAGRDPGRGPRRPLGTSRSLRRSTRSWPRTRRRSTPSTTTTRSSPSTRSRPRATMSRATWP